MDNQVEKPDTPEVPDPNQGASPSQEPPQAVDSPPAAPASSPAANSATLALASATFPKPFNDKSQQEVDVLGRHQKRYQSTAADAAPTTSTATSTTTNTDPQKLKLEIRLELFRVETSNREISKRLTKFLPYDHENSKWWILKFFMELTLFLVLAGIFVALLTSDVLQDTRIWNLGAWRMCLLVFVVLSGWIVAKWVMDMLVFLVDVWPYRINNRQEKVAYLISGLKGSVVVFIWFAVILVAWIFLFRHQVEIIPEHVNEDLDKITRGLAATLVGIFLWVWKSLLMQILAWSFIVTRSEAAVERSCKEQEQVRTLWDLASAERCDNKRQSDSGSGSGARKPGFLTRSLLHLVNMLLNVERETGPGREILVQEYEQIKSVRRNWTPGYLIPKITRTELPVFVEAEEAEYITVERVARATADQLFKKIAKKLEPNRCTERGVEVRYIKKDDREDHNKRLLEKLEEVIPLIKLHFVDGNIQRFRRSDFRKWMSKVYTKRLVLIRTINGGDNVIGNLNRVTSCAAILIIVIVWLLIMGSLTTQVMIAIATQIMALKFIFDDTAKTAFEAIMFVFSTRPFDVGDHCMVDDDQMVVHDMNILSTIFKRADGEKLYYPNSALIGKRLINYYSQGDLSDFIEFKIDPDFIRSGKISKLNKEIETYLNNENKVWNTERCVMKVKKDENDDSKHLVILNVHHQADFYKGGDKKTHRNDLVEKIEKIIRKLSLN